MIHSQAEPCETIHKMFFLLVFKSFDHTEYESLDANEQSKSLSKIFQGGILHQFLLLFLYGRKNVIIKLLTQHRKLHISRKNVGN